MKKIISCLLVAVMLAAMLVVSASAVTDGSQPNYGHIPTVEANTLHADGVKDTAYDVALTIPVNTFLYSNYKQDPAGLEAEAAHKADMASGTVSLVYDGRYIWAFIEVIDKTLATNTDGGYMGANYTQDGVEIMIDWDNLGEDNRTKKAIYQCRINHQGYLSGAADGKTGLQGTVEDGALSPVTFLSGSTVKTDEGYNSEFRIEIPSDKNITNKLSVAFFVSDWNAAGDFRAVATSNHTHEGKGQSECGEWRADKFGYVTFDYVPFTGDTNVVYVVIALVAALGLAAATIFVTRRKNAEQ